jgi:hypothetical protein
MRFMFDLMTDRDFWRLLENRSSLEMNDEDELIESASAVCYNV